MSVLEKVIQMKKEGRTNNEIIGNLQQEKISPKEINDALNQAEIKNAVSDTENLLPDTPAQNENSNQEYDSYTPQIQEIQEQTPAEQPQEILNQRTYAPQTGQEYTEQLPETYGQSSYEDYPSSGGISTDTIIEISEQVFSEKIQKIQKKEESLTEFKTLAETKIENIEERLKRMEKIIDKLQISILDKIGSYGQNLESIKKEMSMMQDSFGKMINPLAEKAEKKHHSSTSHSKKK